MDPLKQASPSPQPGNGVVQPSGSPRPLETTKAPQSGSPTLNINTSMTRSSSVQSTSGKKTGPRQAPAQSPQYHSPQPASSTSTSTGAEDAISVGTWELVSYNVGNSNNNDNTSGGGEDLATPPSSSSLTKPPSVRKLAMLEPSPRSMHSAVGWGESMFIFGGYTGTQRVADLWEFSFKLKTWNLVLTRGQPPTPRDRHVAAIASNAMYVHGGYDGGSRLSDMYKFDFLAERWACIHNGSQQPCPTARHSHAMAACLLEDGSEKLFVFSGYDGNYRNDMWAFDVAMHKWERLHCTGNVPSARYRSAMAVTPRNEIIIIAGHDGTRHLNDCYHFNPNTLVFTRLLTGGLTPIPRDSHGLVSYGNSVILFGGSSGSAMNDLHQLDLTRNRWVPLFPGGSPPHARFCHSLVMCGESRVVVFAGFDGINRRNDMYELSLNVSGAGKLRLEVPEADLAKEMATLVGNEEYADVIFVVTRSDSPSNNNNGTSEVPAHRCLLARVPYFQNLFKSSVGGGSAGKPPRYELANVTRATLLSYLTFVYTTTCEINKDNVVELFEAAQTFGSERLGAMCQNAMMDCLDFHNAATLFAKADTHKMAHLRAVAFDYLVKNFDQVSLTSEFEDLGHARVDLVFEVLKRRAQLQQAASTGVGGKR